MNFFESERLFEEAQSISPGGVTSERQPSKFIPGKYPIFLQKGKGSHVWDVDSNEFIDWVCSYGPLVLGHCNENVDSAVIEDIKNGFCFTLFHPVHNTLCKKLIEIIPCAEMVKIVTSGSDATAAAIRMARVFSGKDKIIRWGYHGWHDWSYGGAGTDRIAYGVPDSVKQGILTFEYNNLDSVEAVFKENKGSVACVIMQPFEASKELPEKSFLEGVKEITHQNDAVLIFDEIRCGFRVALGGSQEYFNVIPDMACFSKAMGNGYPISAVVGKKEIMLPSQKTRISATFFPNTFPMVAALATIKEIEDRKGIEFMWKQGKKIANGLEKLINDFNIEAKMIGLPVIPMLKFTYNNPDLNNKCKEIFFGEMIERGIFLHPSHHWFLSLAHTDEDVDDTLNAAEFSFSKLKKSINIKK
ncbi:MAG: aspartate aminotransferase family protein [Actinobacteria bacterium]|nr:aspartate aminotransferase family protein [Actinomycetota bacterium]